MPELHLDATDLPSDIDRHAFLMRGVGVVAAYALAGSEENARGHLVVTAPTGGSAGVMLGFMTRELRGYEKGTS